MVIPTQNLLLNNFALQYKTEDLRTYFILGSPQILAGLCSYFNFNSLPCSKVETKQNKSAIRTAEALRGTEEDGTAFPQAVFEGLSNSKA